MRQKWASPALGHRQSPPPGTPILGHTPPGGQAAPRAPDPQRAEPTEALEALDEGAIGLPVKYQQPCWRKKSLRGLSQGRNKVDI